MRKVALAVIVAMGVAACASGQAQQLQAPQAQATRLDVSSASYVMAGCRAFIDRSPDLATAYASGLCVGKVEAVGVLADGICLPPEVTVGQMVRVVARYIDQRPGLLHESFMRLARDAMRDAWPCRR